jgi:hypothetical protein
MAASSIARADPSRRHAALSAFAALIALSAWAGAAGLIIGFLGLGPAVESRLPFASPVLGGLALIAVVAVPMSVLAVLAWAGDPMTGDAAVVCGVLQVGWIVVEVLFIWELSFFHPLYLLIGLALILVGRRIQRP